MFSNCALFISYNLRNPVPVWYSFLSCKIKENFEGTWLSILTITFTQTKKTGTLTNVLTQNNDMEDFLRPLIRSNSTDMMLRGPIEGTDQATAATMNIFITLDHH